jgi:hypothetical protein
MRIHQIHAAKNLQSSSIKSQMQPTNDDVRNYWNRRPCNIRHSTVSIGTKNYFNQVEARNYMVELHIPQFAKFERWGGERSKWAVESTRILSI